MHSTPLSLITRSALVAGLLLAGCAPRADISSTGNTPTPANTDEGVMMQEDHALFNAADLTWSDGPPVIPAGAKVAVLEGDPSKAGPFTLRFQFPASYRIAPHTHPAIEHVTVIEGSFSLGMGGTFDEDTMTELTEGGFAVMQAGTQHYAWTENGATIQLHGVGPWGLTYVNPADDPRNATE